MDMAQPPDIIASGPPGVPPPPPPPPPSGRPRDADRLTRKPISIWDRVKFLLLLGLVWFILVWSAMANNPLIGFSDAMHVVFWTASGVMLVGLVIILFLPELPLRANSAVAARAAEDAAAVPEAEVPQH